MKRKYWKKTDSELLRVARYPKATQDYIDYDYIDKLSPADKHWLALFTNMLYNNTNETEFFNVDNTDNEYMREIYKRTNARNLDLYQRMLHSGNLSQLPDDRDEKRE